MSIANTSTSYGSLARAFHWLIAVGILAMIPLGWTAHLWPMSNPDEIAFKTQLFSVHKTIGVLIFVLALARILWAIVQPRPAPLHPERRAETLAAEVVHWVLYAALVIVPLSGWIEHAATDGFAPILLPVGQDLPLVPKSPAVAETFAAVHFLSQWLLVAALVLHVAGAIKHAVIDKDATLVRMARGRDAGTPHPRRGHASALVLAVAAWAAVLGGGAAAGMYGTDGDGAPQLEQAASDWTVKEGTLGIVVMQNGREVSGSFSDWTAAISYEPRDTPGPAGEVEVTISVPSLTLGSVTSQALGADFFAAETHPTATFRADIVQLEDGSLEAQGTLALKQAEVPVTLPFTLAIEDGTAQMEGATTLDRRDYAIGDSMSDGEQLGFDVSVNVALTATRAE
ncbi:hypothetical protein GCM10011415_24990 [Salipiger pallidus]|uniref:Lipid/polyisoprenoid-binding YceI-like domain-containing protein n=1 Tax=Salipiger pallidus TaxID=1775170 RepID=A0A8J2ZKQ9_9RHOB|nr:cytochrome b/b6 domain-containing protein [Salipiger pallidus]GGG75444.1 hypothetical protein GCM10011415_24990 [Salipiger pallidus]